MAKLQSFGCGAFNILSLEFSQYIICIQKNSFFWKCIKHVFLFFGATNGVGIEIGKKRSDAILEWNRSSISGPAQEWTNPNVQRRIAPNIIRLIRLGLLRETVHEAARLRVLIHSAIRVVAEPVNLIADPSPAPVNARLVAAANNVERRHFWLVKIKKLCKNAVFKK